MTFTLPNLPYAYDALAPHMSKETLEYHHDKHHQAYVTNGNNRDQGHRIRGQVPRGDRQGLVRQECAALQQCRPALQPSAFLELDEAQWRRQQIARPSGKEDHRGPRRAGEIQDRFRRRRRRPVRLGLGWLSVKNGKLEISKTPNGENPLVHGATPILGVDVWEHSYYIDYRNRRPDYLKAFVDHLVNWEYVDQLFSKA